MYRPSKSICNQISTKICFFRNLLHQNKICRFSISVKFRFLFLYKTMTKQAVYLNNIARKSGRRLHYLRQSAFKTHHCWRGLMTYPITFFPNPPTTFLTCSRGVRGENKPERKFTGYRTHNYQVVSRTCSPLSQPGGLPFGKVGILCM